MCKEVTDTGGIRCRRHEQVEHRSALSLVNADLVDVQSAQEIRSAVGMFVEPGVQAVNLPVERKTDTPARSRYGPLKDSGIQTAG